MRAGEEREEAVLQEVHNNFDNEQLSVGSAALCDVDCAKDKDRGASSESSSGALLLHPSARSFDGTWSKGLAGKLRFFSPVELLRLFGFPSHFHLPESLSRKKQYELIGNSVNVVVIKNLLQHSLPSILQARRYYSTT